MAELSVKLTADVRRLLDALELTEDQLKRVTLFADQAGESTENLGNRAAPRAARGFQQIGKATANANPTLLEFNRVIQDAPFGIQGVANNITQLTQNFGTLSQQSGGAVAALRALGSAFAGPAGILFAVSAVTSLLVTFGDKLTGTTDKAKELKEELEKINESFSAELGLNEAIAEGLELQGKSTEEINRNRIAILNNQLSSVQAILAQNEALLTQARIQQETVTLWEGLSGFLEQGFQNIIDDIVGDISFVASIMGVLAERTADATGLTEQLAVFAKENADENQKIVEATTQNNKLLTQIQNIRNNILEIEKGITAEKRKQNNIDEVSLSLKPGVLAPVGDSTITTGAPLTTAFNDVSEAQAQFLADLEIFNQQAEQILTEGFTNTIGNIASGIGTAIATGGNLFNAIGGALLSSVGDVMVNLGKQALLIGKTMLAIKFSFKNPFGAIAAGAALIAVGSLFKGAANSVNQIGGGGGSSSVSGGGTFSGGAVASAPTGGFGGGNVVFEIEGTKLVGVLSRTLTRNQRLGAGIIN